jgi:hypothetical protein
MPFKLIARAAAAAALSLALCAVAHAETAPNPIPPPAGASPAPPAPAPNANTRAAAGDLIGRLKAKAADGSAVDLQPEGGAVLRGVKVATGQDRQKVLRAQLDDQLTVAVDDVQKPAQVTAVKEVLRPTSDYQRLIALGAAALVLFLLAMAASRGRAHTFVIGLDNRYSNSKCQLVLWGALLATVYGAAVLLRIAEFGFGYAGGVNITANLLALTGLSAFTFGGAQLVTSQKVDSATQAAAAGGVALQTTTAAAPNLLRDLFANDAGEADLGDFQMILLTLAAVAIFGVTAYHFLGGLQMTAQVTLPDIDTTLLGAFGVGQGAYLIKKAAGPVGS